MDFLKLSPTQINTVLSCPRKYKYRYVDRLEPVGTPAVLAFGRAVHAAIQNAYALQSENVTPDEVAGEFAVHFEHLDSEGVSYNGREDFESLLAKGKALCALWWEMSRDDVLAAKVVSLEEELRHDIGPGLAVFGYPDIVEELGGRLYVGDHKTAGSWGESDEVLAAKSVQLTLYAYLCLKVHGRLPDSLYITVLKKTKTPQVFKFHTERTAAEVDAFEDHVEQVAELIEFYRSRGEYPCNFSRDCSWCSFTPLCWELEDAKNLFTERETRKPAAAPASS